MPEGDTIYRIARALRSGVVGKKLERVELDQVRTPSLERSVERVSTLGKHLFVELEGGELIRTHLGMHGSWHHYAPGERWRAPAVQARLRLDTGERVYVCFRAEEIECLLASSMRRHPRLGQLGPDVLSPELDLDEVVLRSRRLQDGPAPVVDVLLDQRIVCGIGNVFKSETLFLESTHPRLRHDALGDAALRALFFRAHVLMCANLGPWERTTTVDRRQQPRPQHLPREWVYGRSGRACLRCGTRIVERRLGRGRRRTFWCPTCQCHEVD